MTQPVSNNKEPSKLNKLLNDKTEQPSVQSRLPRAAGSGTPPPKAPAPTSSPISSSAASPSKSQPRQSNSRIGPIFWTVASVISLLVNIGTVIVLIVVVQLLGGTKATLAFAQGQANGLLGGLYNNFVKMDAASIKTTIAVDANIPLNIVVPVQTTTQITIAEAAVIPNAHVRINTGSLNIDANAQVTLPAGTPLTVKLDFPLTVQNSIPIHLDVPVNIPLKDTELHDPFVGLQKVVEPYYCLLQPNTQVNGVNVCATAAQILPFTIATPQGTVIP
jgi:hypothetical protein